MITVLVGICRVRQNRSYLDTESRITLKRPPGLKSTNYRVGRIKIFVVARSSVLDFGFDTAWLGCLAFFGASLADVETATVDEIKAKGSAVICCEYHWRLKRRAHSTPCTVCSV